MTRRFAVALAAAGLLVSVGCSKDETVSTSPTTPVTASSSGGGSGTTEAPGTTDPDDEDKDKGSGEYDEVCSIIQELEDLDGAEEDDQTFVLMEEARDAGPDELAEHWDTLAGVFEELAALDENSDEAMTRALELYGDPEFLEAAAAIDDFAEEECGIEIELDPTEEPDAPGGRVDDDDPPSTTSSDDDPTSIDSLQAYLEANYGSEDWWPVLDDATSWGSTGVGDTVEWEIVLSDSPELVALSATQVVDACDAIADYLVTYESDDVSVAILDSSDDVLAVREIDDEACSTP